MLTKTNQFFLISFIVLVVVCSSSFAADTQTQSIELENAFTFSIPNGWKIKDVSDQKFKTAVGGKIDGYTPSISAADEGSPNALKKFVIENEKKMERALKNFKPIQKARFQTDSGITGFRLVAETTQDGMTIRQITYFFSGLSNRKIVITCSAPNSQGNKYDDIFDSAVKTFTRMKQ